ncbi:MAG TPA: glycosyltransferase family 39 protein [Gaiellaceae bacterium]|nr:glycosyltransferase family 39 protein [Gaiellaceae bacterium]
MSARPTGRAEIALGLAALAGSAGFLLARLTSAVGSKPLVEDEAVAGLVAVRPISEVVDTVLTERGGSPLHFVLAHLALVADTSPDALRWLSVVFALATVALTFDLARRLAGPVGGGAAAIVVATSTVLGVYGSFGRMYALFAAVAALALDLFMVALRRRTVGSALAAAAAAAFLPAVHPYGAILLAAEGLVATVLWRGRGFRRAAPVIAVALLGLPFVVANLRLAERYSVGVGDGERLASPGRAWSQLTRALGSFGGGHGPLVLVFVLLAAAGLVLVARREPSLGLLTAIAFVTPPILLAIATTEADPSLSPRHLVFLLPIWAALVGVAVAWLGNRGVLVSAAALAAVAALAVVAPAGGVSDPRDRPDVILGGGPVEVALGGDPVRAPAEFVRRRVREGDVLFPYSPLFLAALPETARATTLPPVEASVLRRAIDRVPREPGALFVAVPSDHHIDMERVSEALGTGAETRVYAGGWLVVRVAGPFADSRDVLSEAARVLEAILTTARPPGGTEVEYYLRSNIAGLRGALTSR